jgi:hypothetical protein
VGGADQALFRFLAGGLSVRAAHCFTRVNARAPQAVKTQFKSI